MGKIDLGSDHALRYFEWSPDRDLNPQYDGMPDVPKAGATVEHLNPATGETCGSAVTFDLPETAHLSGNRWTVESWDPLTLSPSLLCRICGDHGFIRSGRWVPA